MAKIRISSKYTILLLILIAAAAWKSIFLVSGVVPFHADEAVVGLMARHIAAGERPIFFYGQAYMGSLDAFLIATVFQLFGESIGGIRLVQVILHLLVIWTTYLVGREGWGSESAGLAAAGLLAVPAVNLFLYSTVSLGGYGEALLAGNLIILGTLRIANVNNGKAKGRDSFWVLFTAFWIGVGLWSFALSLVYAVPAVLYTTWIYINHRKRLRKAIWSRAGLAVAGFFVGSFPWWLYALQNGFGALVGELTGSAVAVEHGGFLLRTAGHLLNLVLFGIPALLGLRPPWAVWWLALSLIPFVLAIWFLVTRETIKDWKNLSQVPPLSVLLAGLILTQAVAFLFTAFGVDPSGRYFLPLAVALALFAGRVAAGNRFGKWGWVAYGLLLVFHAAGTLQSAAMNPPGITTQFGPQTQVNQEYLPELAQFLEEQGETSGYSNYWVAYPLAFVSEERLIYVPRLPYHTDFRYTARDDRYTPYGELVANAERTAFITTHHPALEDRLRAAFQEAGASWNEKQIGDYVVFYRISTHVRLADINLTGEAD